MYFTSSVWKVRDSDQNFRLARLPCHNSFHLEQVSIDNVSSDYPPYLFLYTNLDTFGVEQHWTLFYLPAPDDSFAI